MWAVHATDEESPHSFFQIEELIPNGANIPVNNENRIEYIYRMADYKLNKQIAKQSQAFKKGTVISSFLAQGRLLLVHSDFPGVSSMWYVSIWNPTRIH